MNRILKEGEPITREQLFAIADAANAVDDLDKANIAMCLLEIEPHVEKLQTLYDTLCQDVRGALNLGKYAEKGTIVEEVFKALQENVQERLSGKINPKLVALHWDTTRPLEFTFKTHWASRVLAAGLAESLKREDGTYWNNVVMKMTHLGEGFAISVQRATGKTVEESLLETRQERDALKAKVVDLEKQIEEMKDDAQQAAWDRDLVED